jgi:hypothetical protein
MDISKILMYLGGGGVVWEILRALIRAGIAYLKKQRQDNTTLALADKDQAGKINERAQVYFEQHANKLFDSFFEAKEEILQLKVKCATTEFLLDEALKREIQKDALIVQLKTQSPPKE